MTRRRDGFSLVEVLVALVVLGTGIAALSNAIRFSSQSQFALKTRTYAGIVADNQLVLARHSVPRLGNANGQVRMAGHDFNWTQTTLRTQFPGLYSVRVQVRASSGKQVLAERSSLSRGRTS